MWPWKRRKEGEVAPPGLHERLTALEVDLRALRRDLEDLDDSFRSFRGRHFKRAAREEEAGEEPAPPELFPAAGGADSVHALKRNGRWPWR